MKGESCKEQIETNIR